MPPIAELIERLKIFAGYLDKTEVGAERNLVEGRKASPRLEWLETFQGTEAEQKLLLPYIKEFQKQQGIKEDPARAFVEGSQTRSDLFRLTENHRAWETLKASDPEITGPLSGYATRQAIATMRKNRLPEGLYADTMNAQMGALATELNALTPDAREARAAELCASANIPFPGASHERSGKADIEKIFGPVNAPKIELSVYEQMAIGPNMSNGRILLPQVDTPAHFTATDHALAPEQRAAYQNAVPGALQDANRPVNRRTPESTIDRAKQSLPKDQATIDSLLAGQSVPGGMKITPELLKQVLGHALDGNVMEKILANAPALLAQQGKSAESDAFLREAMKLDGNAKDFTASERTALHATLDAMGDRQGKTYQGDGVIKAEDLKYAREHIEEFRTLLTETFEANKSAGLPKATPKRER